MLLSKVSTLIDCIKVYNIEKKKLHLIFFQLTRNILKKIQF